MAFPKKGTRKIEVEGNQFFYKISKLKKKSDWRLQENELDEKFMKYASHYGLGMVKDATINIAVQLASNPISNMYIKFHTVIVDGFMGAEQIIEIKPNMISRLIQKGMNDGWDPERQGDFRMELAQKWADQKAPVILQLPNMNEDVGDCENLEEPIEIKINE